MVKGDYREGVITKPMGSPWATFLWGGNLWVRRGGGGGGVGRGGGGGGRVRVMSGGDAILKAFFVLVGWRWAEGEPQTCTGKREGRREDCSAERRRRVFRQDRRD